MEEKRLKELIEQTFERISCPFRSLGFYNEIYQAMSKAFELGKQQPNLSDSLSPMRGEAHRLSAEGMYFNAPRQQIGIGPRPHPKDWSDFAGDEQNVWAAWVDEISDGERRT